MRTAHYISSRDHVRTEKPKVLLKPPRQEALKRRQTKIKFRRQDIEADEQKCSEDIVAALTSDSVLKIISEMEENFKSNISLIDQISAENTEMESRVRELERVLEDEEVEDGQT